MSKGTRLETFDVERGDVVSLVREDVARLYGGGPDIGGRILWEFFRWFLGGEDSHMSDPRDEMLLAGLKEHQRKNAQRMYERLLAQQEKANGRWRKEAKDAPECRGKPRDAVATEKGREGRGENPSASDKDSLLPPGGESGSAGSASGGAAILVPFPSPKYLREVALAKNGDEGAKFDWDMLEDLKLDPVTAILRYVGEEDKAISRNTLSKYLRELGQGTVADIFIDIVEKGEVRARDMGKVLFKRLKNVKETRECES